MSDSKDKDVLLEVKNLTVEVAGKRLLRGVDMIVKEGETHVVFGPNGSGKTTLVNVIMGLPDYKVVDGDILFRGDSILEWNLTERAKSGIGLAFQHPPVVEGVSLGVLLKTIIPDKKTSEEIAKNAHMEDYLEREVNVGFSGGERKKDELLQLLAQAPQLVMFDEPDSGVDVDSIKLMVDIMRKLLQKNTPIRERKNSGIIVTHSGVILEEIHADRGYVLVNGRLVCSGPPLDIFDQVKNHGFERCIKEAYESEKDG
ncbi:ABC transporter ATP-binding protein [candidate division WOR-3 bacterium]|nr:ABC transporter ATP-binding protein [candidate division WOR-3 bacterium]